MNLIVFLIVFGVASGVQALKGLELFKEVQNLKNSVDAVTNNLANFKKSFILTYYVELSKQKIENYAGVDYALTLILIELKNATRASMVQGKDVAHCYQSTEIYVDNKNKVVLKALDKCMKDQISLINSVSAAIYHHLQREDSILEYLNHIVIYCSSGTPFQVALCISNAMPLMKEIVNEYQLPVNELKNQTFSLMYTGAKNYYDCADPVMDSFYGELHAIKLSHHECIKKVN